MSSELLIPFEKLEQRGVKTDVPEKLDSSFFSTVYDQTFKLIDRIDKANEKLKDQKQRSVAFNDVHNVIAFTGRRGTGKTSAMLSVVNTLTVKNLSEVLKKYNYGFLEKNFSTISYTDASMLAESDDIFEIVLSKMFSYTQEHFEPPYLERRKQSQYETQIQKVRNKLCEIYNHYSSIKKGQMESKGTSSNVMVRLADKYNVRKEFEELIGWYTEATANINGQKKGYFVICIDDIDMTQQKHMSVMQCIHQYFMIPGVIVLLSAHISLLTATLQKDYFSTVATSKSTDDEHDYQMHIVKGQTNDFLKKIVSPDMRITMPSWRKKDYTELFPIKIKFGNKDNAKTILEKFPDLEGSMLIKKIQESGEDFSLQPKELIMLMVANRTRIYLDIKGFKFHFMQPDSLRNLEDLFYMFYNMYNSELLRIYKKSEKPEDRDKRNLYFSTRESNRKILLDYLHFKMLEEYSFDSEIRVFLASLLSEPMERRGMKIWDFYYKQISKNKERISGLYGGDFYNNEFNKFKIEEYSFGELYRVLYCATRLGVFSKELVKFILASYSFSMPQFIEIQKRDKYCDEEKGSEYKRTREAFQYTLLGNWCKDLFGGQYAGININISELKKICTDWEKLEQYLKKIVYCLLFNSKSVKNSVMIGNVKGKRESCIIKIYADPTSFIINVLRMKHRILDLNIEFEKTLRYAGNKKENFRYAVLNVLDTLVDGKLSNENNPIRRILKVKNPELCEKQGLIEPLDQYLYELINDTREKLIDNTQMPWFFLKHTDLTYNVMKRVASSIIYESDNNLKAKKSYNFHKEIAPIEVMRQFYKKVADKLEEQDKVYFSSDDPESFKNIFDSNDIVKMITNFGSEEEYGISFEFFNIK